MCNRRAQETIVAPGHFRACGLQVCDTAQRHQVAKARLPQPNGDQENRRGAMAAEKGKQALVYLRTYNHFLRRLPPCIWFCDARLSSAGSFDAADSKPATALNPRESLRNG